MTNEPPAHQAKAVSPLANPMIRPRQAEAAAQMAAPAAVSAMNTAAGCTLHAFASEPSDRCATAVVMPHVGHGRPVRANVGHAASPS